MTTQTIEQLSSRHCTTCDGGAQKLSASQVIELLKALAGWRLADDGRQLRKDWQAEDFAAGMEFLNRVAQLAEQEDHHPDLHLEGYRRVWIALATHAAGGLTENDFILAAKIDRLADAADSGTLKPW